MPFQKMAEGNMKPPGGQSFVLSRQKIDFLLNDSSIISHCLLNWIWICGYRELDSPGETSHQEVDHFNGRVILFQSLK